MLAACFRYIWLGLLAFTSGCAMCGSCDDETYGAYGGRWERLDQCYGRVGSIFTPEVGARIPPDELMLSGMEPVPAEENKPAEATPADGMPGEEVPAEGMPAEDAAPRPPATSSENSQSSDASVLRQPPRALR